MSTESVQDSPVCVARDINHVCIAVRDIVETLRFYETAFGVGPAEVESVEDQAVLAAIVTMGSSQTGVHAAHEHRKRCRQVHRKARGGVAPHLLRRG